MKGGVASATAGCAKRLDWQVATKVSIYGRVVWATDSFALCIEICKNLCSFTATLMQCDMCSMTMIYLDSTHFKFQF
jgi:hypothetical protein